MYGKGVKKTNYDSTERYPRSVQSYSKDSRIGGLHPTQKPVGLIEMLVKTYTNPGETVLDNCMGSGTTGEACVGTGRRFIGMEIEEKYFEVAQDRISAA